MIMVLTMLTSIILAQSASSHTVALLHTMSICPKLDLASVYAALGRTKNWEMAGK